jgi:hypothetical protein
MVPNVFIQAKTTIKLKSAKKVVRTFPKAQDNGLNRTGEKQQACNS